MPAPDPNASDWSDLDLLTVSEALGRLEAEIAAVSAERDELPAGPDRDLATRRLGLLGRARDRALAGPTPRRGPDPATSGPGSAASRPVPGSATSGPEPGSAATRPGHVPAELVREIDHVFGADFLADPFAAFGALRDRPVHWSPVHGGYWVLTRGADIRAAMQRPDLFSNWPTGIPAHVSRTEKLAPLEMDPPEHTAYRRVIAPLLAPKAVATRIAAIERSATELVDAIAPRGSCELVAEFAGPFPTRIFTNLLGLPPSEARRFVTWNNLLLHSQDRPQVRREAGIEINTYLRELIADRRREPRDDMVSALLAADLEGAPTTDEQVQNLCFLLFIAGLDTVTAALSFSFRFLAEHPGHRRLLVERPELVPGAAEELLRVHAFINPARTVTRDAEFAGVAMRRGDRVLVSTALASRDPEEFDDPLEVRFDRPANRHLAFGAGPHRCAGSHLARDEMRTALSVWHARIPDYRPAPGEPVTVHAGGSMGLDRLPLVWDPPGSDR